MVLNEFKKEVTKNTKACETINKLHDNIVDLKAENDNLYSKNIELKESMLHTEYIVKKKNMILNGVKDSPQTGVKMEKILNNFFKSMFREDSHFANSIGQGDLQIGMVTQLGKYTDERNRPILVTFAML